MLFKDPRTGPRITQQNHWITQAAAYGAHSTPLLVGPHPFDIQSFLPGNITKLGLLLGVVFYLE